MPYGKVLPSLQHLMTDKKSRPTIVDTSIRGNKLIHTYTHKHTYTHTNIHTHKLHTH